MPMPCVKKWMLVAIRLSVCANRGRMLHSCVNLNSGCAQISRRSGIFCRLSCTRHTKIVRSRAWLKLVVGTKKCWRACAVVLRRLLRSCAAASKRARDPSKRACHSGAPAPLLFRLVVLCLRTLSALYYPCTLHRQASAMKLNHQPDESRRPPPTSLTAELESQETPPSAPPPKHRNRLNVLPPLSCFFRASTPVEHQSENRGQPHARSSIATRSAVHPKPHSRAHAAPLQHGLPYYGLTPNRTGAPMQHNRDT